MIVKINQNDSFEYIGANVSRKQMDGFKDELDIDGVHQAGECIVSVFDLPPGDYIVISDVQWKNKDIVSEYTLRTYSKIRTTITPIPKVEFPQFLENAKLA